jgi:hypothetical protein
MTDWTLGSDWTDTANKIRVVDGMVSGTTDEMARRIAAGQNLLGSVPDFLS